VRHAIDSATVTAVDSFPLPAYEGKFYRIDFERGGMVMPIPYAPTMTWRFDGHDGYWVGVSDQYRFVHHTFAGDTLRIVERAIAPTPVSAAERAAAEKSVAQVPTPRMGAMKSAPPDLSLIPATKPFFVSFVIDEMGHIWVARETSPPDAPTRTELDVFDPRGVYLGSLTLGVTMRPTPVIRRDRIAGVARDSLGTETVVVYRLDRR
jgi:hypothetical protein